MCYFAYSDYLKNKYGEKVYKLPINLPVTCPNRDGTKGVGGCIFCSGAGASYELLDKSVPVREQLLQNMAYMGRRFGAKKFIAYFQNYSNTYLPVDEFAAFMRQAVMENVVEISVSTRPDCISQGHLDALAELYESGVNISLELGLQSANDSTLNIINRGHTVADFVNACRMIRAYPFEITAHIILNLPWDSLEDVIAAAKLLNTWCDGAKLHSLYIPKGTRLCQMYENGEIDMGSAADYVQRAVAFLEHARSDMPIHRLASRAGKEHTVFENYGMSWWRLRDEIVNNMKRCKTFQGRKCLT